MVDAVISPVLTKLGAIIGGKITDEFNLVKGVKKELLDISNKLKTISNVLDDAEKRGLKEQSVKHWLNKLEITACEMEDIVDEWEYYSLHKQNTEPSVVQELLNFLLKSLDCCFLPSSCLCLNDVSIRRDIAKKIQNVKATLDEILKEMDGFKFIVDLVNSPPATNPVQTTPLIDMKEVHGEDIRKKKEDIVSKLMLNGGDTQILSIVGTGGLGKTTLAKLVYNDEKVKGCYGLRIWICVSNPFDVAAIAIGIVNEVGIQTISPNSNQLALVLKKLEESISGKKFLLVLDDVWTEDNTRWEPLKISLQCGAAGSKILVTTRKVTVAKMFRTLDDDMYHPNKLSEEECWSLLRYTSLPGKSEKECGKFEDVGKKIASKCNGLPLAAVVLGKLLQFKDLEGWQHVENSEIWQLERVEVDLFPHLVLSYNELSPILKRCFSYCSVYPKDHKIHAGTLIEEWIAQGYLGSDSGNGALELNGRDNLKNLAMRCLFQDIEKSGYGEEIKWCKMHDIVHDFAIFLRKNDYKERSCQVCDPSLVSHVQEYRSLSWYTEESSQVCDCMKSIRALRIMSVNSHVLVRIKPLIHLRWLDISWTNMSKDGLEIICRLYFLQTLLLSQCKLTEIPREIGNLVHLRRLDLSKNEELKQLPESIGSLVELRTLSLHGCSIEEIPREIGNLVQLRRLDLSENEELKQLPESIGSLVELRTLSLEDCSIKEIPREIGNLVRLRRLDLSENEELKQLPESIGNLAELRTLSLPGCSIEEIPREIGNLVELRKLDLRSNWGIKELPESISSLVELQILKIGSTDINCLPEALGELSNLHTLELCPFKVGSQYNKLGFLKKLHCCLSGSLVLVIFINSLSEMVELVEDARQAQLKTLQLYCLMISFEGTMDEMEHSASSMWTEVVEALVPHHSLNKLEISGYKGSRLPHLMSSPFNFIKEIHLDWLSEVSSLPAMGKLPFLEILEIWFMEQLKLVGREFLGIESSCDDVVVAFPKLETLKFNDCSKWEEWEDITEEEEESATISIMPCLTKLTVIECDNLKKLPHRLLHKVSSSLQSLNIWESSELVKTYGEDKEGSAWRSISQHNPQLQLQLQLRLWV